MPTATNLSLKFLLRELVHMPTLTEEKATTQAAIDWVKYLLRDLPLHITEAEYNGSAAVTFNTQTGKRPAVMLHAHIDVSPAPPEQFKFHERDGHYIGRGTFDMKFAIAAYMRILLELGDRLPEYSLALNLSSDEEGNGNMYGVQGLMAAGWRPGVVFNPDSTGNGQWAIQRAAKGALGYRITASGQAGHGSRTWLFPSANLRLINYVRDVYDQFPTEPCGDPEHGHPTLNIGVLKGGVYVNQVAAHAEAELDIRIMPGHTADEIDTLLAEVATRHEGISIQREHYSGPVGMDPADPHFVRLERIMHDVTGIAPEHIVSHGGSESTHFANRGIPVLMFGPPGGNHHGDGEWVSAAGLEHTAEILRRYIEETARVRA